MNSIDRKFTNIEPMPKSGMYCRLYKALRFNQWWVLKTLKPEYAQNQSIRNALYKEYEIARNLDSPYIVRYMAWEFVPEVGDYCIVEEYIQGVTLDQYFAAPNVGVKEKYKVFMEIVFGLKYCAQQQVVHRDLKPSNVMVTNNGANIKLIDFGLSDRPDFAILKMPAGSRRYMAPEQAVKGANVDFRADIYALGKIMENFKAPKRFEPIYRRCTDPDPEKRYQSFDELTNDLKKRMNLYRVRVRTLVAASLVLVFAAAAFLLGFGRLGGWVFGFKGEKQVYDRVPSVYYADTADYSDPSRYSCQLVPRYGCKIYTLRPDVEIPGPIDECEAVDLGLSVKWAPFNLGCDHESLIMTGSLVGYGDSIGNITSGNPDDYPKGAVTPKSDIVRKHWGGEWRMPTFEEFRELVNKCQWRVVNEYGHHPCFVVTGPNGNSIVINCTGYRYLGKHYEALYVGYYWTSTYGSNPNDDRAYYFSISVDNYRFGEITPIYGFAIRPVLPRSLPKISTRLAPKSPQTLPREDLLGWVGLKDALFLRIIELSNLRIIEFSRFRIIDLLTR